MSDLGDLSLRQLSEHGEGGVWEESREKTYLDRLVVTIVGLCPAEDGASWGQDSTTAQRLAKMMAWPEDAQARFVRSQGDGVVYWPLDFRSTFVLRNLSQIPGADRRQLRQGANALDITRGRFVLLGYDVVRAFGRRCWPREGGLVDDGAKPSRPPRFCWYRSRSGGRVLVIPHPSGRCRDYNDPAVVSRVTDLLSSL